MNEISVLPRTASTPNASTRKRPRMWLRMIVMLLAVGLVAGGLFGFQRFKAGILKNVVASIRSEVPTVATARAATQDWQSRLTATGTARASNGTDISPEIAGIVGQISFESGQIVPAGSVLLRLRPNDDAAKLAQLQANADLATVTLQRDQKQLAAHGVAQATVDTDAANVKVTRAQVAAQQAIIDQKIIRAPFAGRLGVRQVDLGQYVGVGAAIVSLQQLNPMFVDFYLPQQAVSQLRQGQPVAITADAWADRVFKGEIVALNAKIDAASRMIQVRASVPNADGALLPGMYTGVSIATAAPRALVTIPAAAVAYNPYGSLVYLVQTGKDDKGNDRQTVKQQFVITGDARGDQVSIVKGVGANDEVVTAGQLKLHNGAPIKIDNTVKPADDAAPAPQDH